MNKNTKFFSLLYDNSIKAAPGTKKIPQADFSQLLTAKEVVETSQKEAEKYRLDVIKECEQIKEQAKKEGYADGFQAWSEHIAKLEEEILQVRADIEKVLAPIALKAAKKIVGRELEQSEQTIVDIVSNSLKSVAQHKKITIYVSRQDWQVLEDHRQELKNLFEQLESLSIREREGVSPGGCIIETEGGIINAQIENQWRILENAFTMLLSRKKG